MKRTKEEMIRIVAKRISWFVYEYAENQESGQAFIEYLKAQGLHHACKLIYDDFPDFDEIYYQTISNKELVTPTLIDEDYNFFADMEKIEADVKTEYIKE